MLTVIKNGTVITMAKNREKYEKIDIVIENDKIINLVPNYEGHYDTIIDATDKIVMPGLINGHTHLGMSIFRATNDNLNLDDWLSKKIWPIEDQLNDEDMYYTTLLSCVEMIKTGSIMANDMYFCTNGSIKAILKSKIRCLFSRCILDADGRGKERVDEFLKLYNDYKNEPLIKFSVAPHAFYTCSKEYLKQCSDLALELNLPVHIHFCENLDEVDKIKKEYGTTYNALCETGLIRNKLILAHGTFIDEIAKYKDSDVSIIHNPISNLNLGCGVSDVVKNRKYVNIGLGTDGQGSGNNMNLFYHMSIVDLLQKGVYKDPTVFSSYDVLKMATINGAKALGVDDIIGSIEIGKQADIIIINQKKIENYPSTDLITNLVHNTEGSNVDTTIINGEVLMQNHELNIDIDEAELKNKIQSIINRVL